LFFFAVIRDPLPKLQIAGAPLAAKTICNLSDLSSHLVFKVRMNPLPFALFQPHFCSLFPSNFSISDVKTDQK
jgi:hypothetical protein